MELLQSTQDLKLDAQWAHYFIDLGIKVAFLSADVTAKDLLRRVYFSRTMMMFTSQLIQRALVAHDRDLSADVAHPTRISVKVSQSGRHVLPFRLWLQKSTGAYGQERTRSWLSILHVMSCTNRKQYKESDFHLQIACGLFALETIFCRTPGVYLPVRRNGFTTDGTDVIL
jgi:hypothetical protein